MSIHKPRLTALMSLFLGAVAGGDGAWAWADDANPQPAPGRMFVVGRVLDPGGNPVSGSTVAVIGGPERGQGPGTEARNWDRGPERGKARNGDSPERGHSSITVTVEQSG
jgi:hypothetical protein